MMGELTEKMAFAISSSKIRKILLPLGFENIELIGAEKEPIPHMILKLVDKINLLISREKKR